MRLNSRHKHRRSSIGGGACSPKEARWVAVCACRGSGRHACAARAESPRWDCWDHPAAELLLETLLARPGFDRRAIDYEMFVGQKVLSLGMRQGQH